VLSTGVIRRAAAIAERTGQFASKNTSLSPKAVLLSAGIA
jgi:hypothetical protein